MDIQQQNGKILLPASHFDVEKIFNCGQAFHRTREADGSYTTVAFDRALNVTETSEGILFDATEEEFRRLWVPYFDLDTDYAAAERRLSQRGLNPEIMKKAGGIRILRQPFFETVATFILSANNNIPRIQKSVALLSEHYGVFLGNYMGSPRYAFPLPEVLASVEPEELRRVAGVGYRDRYLVGASKKIAEEGDFENILNSATTEEARKLLLTLPGVGPKVADCILLFGCGRGEVFPVDVWIRKVMNTYFGWEETRDRDISARATELFGEDAGYAQQCLFYCGREGYFDGIR